MSGDALYNYIFNNASFWRSVNLRTKRASSEIERRERIYLLDYINKTSINDIIENMRNEVRKYIFACYGKTIEEYNQRDEEKSLDILQDRLNRRTYETQERAKKEFALAKVPWVDKIDISNLNTTSSIMNKLEKESSDYARITLSSSICETPTSESFSSIANTNHYSNIEEICLKYKDNPCSIEIVEYLKSNDLV
jgi:hypothetical protein